MIEEFGKLIIQILEIIVKHKLRTKDNEPIRTLYQLHSRLTAVIQASAHFLDAVECFAVATRDRVLQEQIYDRLILLGRATEELAQDLASDYISPARFSLGDSFGDELEEMVGLKCEHLEFWAHLFSNPNVRMQRKLVWLTVRAKEQLRPEMPHRRMWMAPAQCAKGTIEELQALADRSYSFVLQEMDLSTADELHILDFAREGRRWVAAMRNGRATLGEYLRGNYPLDKIWPV